MKKTLQIVAMSLMISLFFHSNGMAGPDGRLKVYCGITMIQAMSEIAKQVEAKYDSQRIKLVKGGSDKLMKQLLKKKDGDPNKGSIGKATKKILEKKGIYEQVMKVATTTDNSKTLSQAIKSGAADMAINWFAASPEGKAIFKKFGLYEE